MTANSLAKAAAAGNPEAATALKKLLPSNP